MTLERNPDGSVTLAGVNEWQMHTLRNLPSIADPGTDESALRRLFPAPFPEGEVNEREQEDLKQIVHPELAQLFETSLARVLADVRNARLEPPAPETEQDVPGVTEPRILPPRPAAIQRPRPPRTAHILSPVVRAVEMEPEPEPEPEPEREPDRWQLTIPASHVEDWYRAMNQARLMLSERFGAHRTDTPHLAEMFVRGKMEPLIQYGMLSSLCDWWVHALMQP